MIIQKAGLAAATLAVSALISISAQAQDTKPAAAPTTTAAATAAKPETFVGLTVISSDGALLGKVTSLKASADGKGQLLYVTSPTDGKIFAVPSELAAIVPTGLQVKMTAADLRKSAK